MEVDTLATLGIDIQTDKAKAGLDSLNQSIKQTTDAAKQMTAAFGPTTGGANEVFGPIVPGAKAAADSTKQLATEMLKGSEVTRGFRDVMHTLDPVLMSAGVGMNGLGAFAMAARAGVAGLGIAIAGGLTVELARVGDESVLAKDKLSDFFNSTTAGSAAFERLQQTASTFGGTVAGLAPSLMSLTRTLQEQERVSGVVYAPLASGLTTVGQRAAALQETLLGYARASGSTWSEATASVTKLSSAIQNSKQFTSDLLKQIEQESPKLANALANAFGYNGEDAIVRFNAALAKSPRSINDLITALANLQGASKKAFEESGSGFATFTQSIDTAWNSLKRMVQSFADATGLSGSLSASLKALDQAFRSSAQGWSDLGKILDGLGVKTAFIRGEFDLAIIAMNIFFGGPGSTQTALTIALGYIGDKLDGVIAKAKDAAAWLARALGFSDNTGAPSTPGGVAGGPGPQPGSASGLPGPEPGSVGGLPGEMSGGGGVGGDTANEGGGDFPNEMATGGDFTVGGDGGIDTTKVSFMATRGEHVTVTPFGRSQATSGYGSGHFADGGDFTVDQNSTLTGSKPDQAAMPSGLALSNTLTNMSGTFEKLGITIGDIGKTITGAGNDKMIDVVRLGTMQTIAAIQMAGDKTVNAIAALNNTDQQIIASISSLSSAMTATASAGSSAGAPAAPALTGIHMGLNPDGTPLGSSPSTGGGSKGGKDTTPPPGGNMSLWNKLYGDLYNADGSPKTGGGAGGSTSSAPSAGGNTSKPAEFKSTIGLPDAFGNPGAASDVVTGSPTGAGTDATASQDYAGGYDSYADGGDFDVPSGFEDDTYHLQAQTGEHVKITPKHLNKPGTSASSGVGNVTVIIQTQDLKSFVNTEAQTGQQVRRMLDRSMAKR